MNNIEYRGVDTYCREKYCRRTGKYVVINPNTNVIKEIESNKFYCLQHARFIFRSECQIFSDKGVVVYKIEMCFRSKG